MLDQSRSASKMVKAFQDDPSLMEKLKTEPEKVLNDVAKDITQETWTGDKMLYRIAVIVLGALALIAALGSIVLVLNNHTTPEVLVALGSAAVGALVGLFAPAPTK